MLARSTARRFTPRPFLKSMSRNITTQADLQNRDEFKVPDIEVICYKQGERHRQIIPVVNGNSDRSPRTPHQRPAVAFDRSIVGQMTPTLQRTTLQDKIAVVTGGARGLGFNMAQGLIEAGVSGLALMDVQQETGDNAAETLAAQTGIDVHFYKLDVRDADAVNEAVQDTVSRFGRIDVLINSAGIADSNIRAEKYDAEMFRRLIDINLTGNFLVAQAVAREMIATKSGGSMIFIASMSASIVNYPQQQCAYNASKAGVIQLMRSLAAEWAMHKIRVNSISPGYMDTPLTAVPGLDAQKSVWIDHTPQKRLGAVDELNGLALFMASDASSYMTGSNVVIDGGYTVW
ncbi:MAG: hypothetical protein M1820_007981 [Bogoriella megaspora]|nr:MAG: hypothetical protein M1820_007981 [Bogoriella megaspora]